MSPWRQTNKRTRSENRASQQIDQGLLTFAINPTFQENNIITSKKINNINNLHFQDVNINNIITPKITVLNKLYFKTKDHLI